MNICSNCENIDHCAAESHKLGTLFDANQEACAHFVKFGTHKYYLGVFKPNGYCLKIVEGHSIGQLKQYAERACTGQKYCLIGDSEGVCVWACKGIKGLCLEQVSSDLFPIGQKMNWLTKIL